MKAKIYMRLARSPRARDGWKVEATTSPNPRAIVMGSDSEPLHTIHFALELTIPDHLLKPAQWPVVEIELPDGVVTQIPDEIIAVAP